MSDPVAHRSHAASIAEAMTQVWDRRQARGATLTLDWSHQRDVYRIIAFRVAGWRYEYAIREIDRTELSSNLTATVAMLTQLDQAIADAVDQLHDVTTSEALVAGELRRCRHEDTLERDIDRAIQRMHWRARHG